MVFAPKNSTPPGRWDPRRSAAVAADDVHRDGAIGAQQGPGLTPETMGDEKLRYLQDGAPQWCERWFINPMNTIVISAINHSEMGVIGTNFANELGHLLVGPKKNYLLVRFTQGILGNDP